MLEEEILDESLAKKNKEIDLLNERNEKMIHIRSTTKKYVYRGMENLIPFRKTEKVSLSPFLYTRNTIGDNG